MNSTATFDQNLGTKTYSYWVWWERICNVLLALFFFRFVYVNTADMLESARLSTVLVLLKVSADTICHLIRRPAKEISTSVFDWAIGVCGSFTSFFYVGVPGEDHLLGAVIQMFGMSLQVYAMLSLNRSIGFVAANRGVKTRGMYRFVRHPLYCAYCVSFFGFLLNQPTIHNLSVYAIMVLLFVLRIIAEERVLSRSPDYIDYRRQVRYRLIPGII